MTKADDDLWEQIAEKEPRVLALLREAESTLDEGESFCANLVFYGPNGLKSRLTKLVGWERGLRDASDEELIAAGLGHCITSHRRQFTATELLLKYPTIPRTCPPDKLLDSSAAYDVVYEKVYSALPDCRACNCMTPVRQDETKPRRDRGPASGDGGSDYA